jgi:gliding motility-associated lipoprotein GldB
MQVSNEFFLYLFVMRYNVKLCQIYLFFLVILVFVSCRQDTKPDVSAINLDVKISRFDKDVYNGKGKDLQQTNTFLQKQYGPFYEDYVHRMIGTPEYTNEEILAILYKDQAYVDLTKEVDSVFTNLQPLEQELTQAFKYIKYYYPQSKTPKFISFVSGFAVQTPIGDDYMGIGLDMFLGKNSKFYRAIIQSVPTYLSRRFTPAYITPRLTETYAREELFQEKDSDRSLLAKMIYNGKILYFMDQVLDDQVPDSVKIGYTKAQLDWCTHFEGSIWGYYLENNLLFETDYQKIQVFLSEGPFTPGLGERNESAPKLGIWIGWQIVRKYMSENKEVTLQQLMTEQDSQKILTASKYKPKQEK